MTGYSFPPLERASIFYCTELQLLWATTLPRKYVTYQGVAGAFVYMMHGRSSFQISCCAEQRLGLYRMRFGGDFRYVPSSFNFNSHVARIPLAKPEMLIK
jgi:hypothetical protein